MTVKIYIADLITRTKYYSAMNHIFKLSDIARPLVLLQQFQWPGNIRELENVIHRAVILCPENRIRNVELEAQSEGLASGFMRSKNIVEVEKEHILSVLKECDWKVFGPHGAAEVLGMKVATLNSRMKKLGIKKLGMKKNNRPYKA